MYIYILIGIDDGEPVAGGWSSEAYTAPHLPLALQQRRHHRHTHGKPVGHKGNNVTISDSPSITIIFIYGWTVEKFCALNRQ